MISWINGLRWALLLGVIATLLAATALSQEASAPSAPKTEEPPTPVETKSVDEVKALNEKIRQQGLIQSVTIFVLAIFVGFEVITKVPPTLHTPLMSGTNAISGITLVGAIIVAGTAGGFASFVGMVAVALATINVVGGFLVTHRMLSMFRRK